MFSSVFDAEGVIAFEQWAVYMRKCDRNDDDDDEEGEEIVKEAEMKAKKGYVPRNYTGYDPEQAIESEWHGRYVSGVGWFKQKKHFQQFRRRFWMPYTEFKGLVKLAREQKWFPQYERMNACKQPGFIHSRRSSLSGTRLDL